VLISNSTTLGIEMDDESGQIAGQGESEPLWFLADRCDWDWSPNPKYGA